MATPKQRAVVAHLVENRGASFSKAMTEAGYMPKTVKNPKNVTESKGFIELLEQSGLKLDFLNTALYEDIRHKPRNRYKELELAYRLHGKLDRNQDTPDVSVNIAFMNTLDTQ